MDCCNSGAFSQGTKAATGVSIGTATAFEAGYGRIILTASDATQFAWEGDKVIGETDNSLFTHYLVAGLEGAADLDGDGRITVDEVYDYAYEKVRLATPKQTPSKFSSKQQGEIVLRQNMRIEDIKPVSLPGELIEEIEDTRPYVREAAVQKLEKILKGKNIGLARSARDALEKLAIDDNTTRRVSQMATQLLESIRQAERAEEERKAREEAERLATLKAEEERLAREKAEAEQRAKQEAERLLAERKAEEERKAKKEAKRRADLKAKEERLAREKAEAEQKAKEEAERFLAEQKAEGERLAREKAEAERKAKEEAERLLAAQKAEEERLAREKDEIARLARKTAEENRVAEEQRVGRQKAEDERKAREQIERSAETASPATAKLIEEQEELAAVQETPPVRWPRRTFRTIGVAGAVICILIIVIKLLPGIMAPRATASPAAEHATQPVSLNAATQVEVVNASTETPEVNTSTATATPEAVVSNQAVISAENASQLAKLSTFVLDSGSEFAFSKDFSIAATWMSPDLLGTGGGFESKLWDLTTGNLISTITAQSLIEVAAISPDNAILAVAFADNTVQLVEINDGQLIRTLTGHSNDVKSLAFSSDGRLLATGSKDSTIKLWEVNTGNLLYTFSGHTGTVYQLEFSPDINYLISASGDDTVRVWDIGNLSVHQTFRLDSPNLLDYPYFTLLGDINKIAATAYISGSVTYWLWDLSSGETMANYQGFNFVTSQDGHFLAFQAIDESKNRQWGSRVEVGVADDISLRNLDTGNTLSLKGCSPASFSPDGSLLLDHCRNLWDVQAGTFLGNINTKFYMINKDWTRALTYEWNGNAVVYTVFGIKP